MGVSGRGSLEKGGGETIVLGQETGLKLSSFSSVNLKNLSSGFSRRLIFCGDPACAKVLAGTAAYARALAGTALTAASLTTAATLSGWEMKMRWLPLTSDTLPPVR